MSIVEFMENNHQKIMRNLSLGITEWTVDRGRNEISSVKLRLHETLPGISQESSVLVVVIGKDGISANELFRVTKNEERVFHLNGSLTDYEFIPMATSKQLLIIDKNIFSGIEKLVTQKGGANCDEVCRK